VSDDPRIRTWTVREVLAWTRDFLAEHGSDTARLDAEVLVAHVVTGSRMALYVQHDRPLTEDERGRLRALVRRPFAVDRRVLVPRPETEVLIEECLAPWRATTEGGPVAAPPARVADIGTGSGAIAVVLARELPGAPAVFAVDASEDALQVAAANVARHGLGDRVALRHGRLLEPLADTGPLDLVAANLPYIPRRALPRLPRTVRDFEPHGALDGGEDGLDLVRPCVAQAARQLVPGGWLVLELAGEKQVAVVRAEALAAGFDEAHVRTDYAGRERVLRLRRAA
jgi:release factor glutamine methyltransferase